MIPDAHRIDASELHLSYRLDRVAGGDVEAGAVMDRDHIMMMMLGFIIGMILGELKRVLW